jgi:hypothetical protein
MGSFKVKVTRDVGEIKIFGAPWRDFFYLVVKNEKGDAIYHDQIIYTRGRDHALASKITVIPYLGAGKESETLTFQFEPGLKNQNVDVPGIAVSGKQK